MLKKTNGPHKKRSIAMGCVAKSEPIELNLSIPDIRDPDGNPACGLVLGHDATKGMRSCPMLEYRGHDSEGHLFGCGLFGKELLEYKRIPMYLAPVPCSRCLAVFKRAAIKS